MIQLYGVTDADDFPRRVLLGFASAEIEAGQSLDVVVTASTRPLQRWTTDGFTSAASTVLVEAASHSGDPAAISTSMHLS